jgi:hypothetical protein
VEKVEVTGLSGPEAPRLRKQLEQAGLQQSTLHLNAAELKKAVASAPEIRAVTAMPDFPHGLRIDVTENHPVAILVVAGRGALPIAANGTIMPDAENTKAVPSIKIAAMPGTHRPGGQQRISDARTNRLIAVAATAPPALLHRAASIELRKGEGIVVVMRQGPRIVFGDNARLTDKWAAAAGVLASPGSSGASYVDVRLPERPVAGGLTVPGQAPGTSQGAPVTPAAPSAQATTPAAQTTPPVTSTPAPAPAAPVAPATSATPQQTAPATPQATTPTTQTNTQP